MTSQVCFKGEWYARHQCLIVQSLHMFLYRGFIFHSNGLHPSKILETDNKTVMCDAKYQPPNKTAIQNNIQNTIKAQR